MSIIILGKLFVGGAALVGATAVMYFGTHLLLDVDVSVYGVTKDVTNKSTVAMTFEKVAKNFACKIRKIQFDCSLAEITFDNTKKTKFITTDDVNNTATTDQPTKLHTKDQVFKITAKKSQLKAWEDNKELEIIQIKAGDVNPDANNNQYAKLTKLFSFEDKKFYGTTQYFVGKAGKPEETLNESVNQCAWNDDPSTPNTNPTYVSCVVYIFGNESTTPNNIDDWTFTKKSDATSDTEIEQDKYYLIKFTDMQDIIKKGTKTVIFAKKSDAKTNLVEFTEIHSAYLVEDKNLLILG